MTEYDENFLGVALPLPSFTPARVANIVPPSAQLPGGLATYPNYAVVTDKKFRAPAFAVLHIDQPKLKTSKRSNQWKIDSRVGAECQLDNSYYAGGDSNPWDKGHMADRESAAWGDTPAVAQESADQTFYYANACLQHKNLNEDEWLALEVWVMELNIVKNGRLTVFTGPIFGDHPRIVTPPGRTAATVPVGFFKVACFIDSGTGQLGVRAFIIYQDAEALLDLKGRKTFNYTKYQVTVTEIEQLTELRFPDMVREKNPLLFPSQPDHREKTEHQKFSRARGHQPARGHHPPRRRAHACGGRQLGSLHRIRAHQSDRRWRGMGLAGQLRKQAREPHGLETRGPRRPRTETERQHPRRWHHRVCVARSCAPSACPTPAGYLRC